jgi:probable F420-dependent oxidoreductase
MELGVYIPNSHHGLGLDVYTAGKPFPPGLAVNPTTLRAMAGVAEAMGFDAVWVGDHVIIPPHTLSAHFNSGHPEGGDLRADEPIFDPLATMAYLGGRTEHVKLALGVLVVPYRNPVTTAKFFASLDVLTNGRVILGVGVGWLKEEFDAVGVPFESRGAMTDEYIHLMRLLWTADKPEFQGRFFTLPPGLSFKPKPLRGSIPIWIGGNSQFALERSARIGDAWFGVYLSMADVAAKIGRLRQLTEAAGRDAAQVAVAHQARFYVLDEPYPDAPPCIGSPRKIADDIERFHELGVSHLQLTPPPGPTTESILAQMRRFRDEVRPLLPAGVLTGRGAAVSAA